VRFTETALSGAFIIDVEPHADARGFFARTACVDEFAAAGLNGNFVQQSVSWNPRKGTLRGLHFQIASGEEDKLVRVTRGAIFDVIVDLRQDSPTFGKWASAELSADNHRQFYIPRGFAHGFQTLQDDTEVFYEMTVRFQPGVARGIRWDDADLGISWPIPVDPADTARLSQADATRGSLADYRHA
jgi:dTDP-4-dehydrorhamnose 3,5-epimerase